MIDGSRKVGLVLAVLLLSACAVRDPIFEAKQAQRNLIVRQCLNNLSNVAILDPQLRTKIIHNCNALANRAVPN